MMQVETSSMVTILPNCSSASDSEVSNTSKTGPIVTAKAFNPSMLEPWYFPASATGQQRALKTFHDGFDCQPQASAYSKNTQFYNDVVSALQQLYSSGRHVFEIEEQKNLSQSSNSSFINQDFNSWKEVDDFIQEKCEKCLDKFSNEMESMKKIARNIVTVLTSYLVVLEINDLLTMQSKIEEKVFVSASTLHAKDESLLQKAAECMLQTFLRLEWLVFAVDRFKQKIDSEWAVHQITHFLRIISLSVDVGKMKDFLCNILVDFYTEKLGDVLVEIHNDLMIPLPQALREYSLEKEAEDSFFDGSVRSDLPASTGPFSLLSSDESRDSVDFRPNKKQFQLYNAQQMKPVVARQIAVPKRGIGVRYTRQSSGSNDAVKLLFDSNNKTNRKAATSKDGGHCNFKSPTKRALLKSASQDVIRVRRDLFASPSKRRRKASSLSSRASSPDKRSQQKIRRAQSVMDTPEAKQHFTALARQRLRERRSWTSQEDDLNQSLIDESPLKQVENHTRAPFVKFDSKARRRSPRHSIMLTRRHSFYTDGSNDNCRTVTRAKIVHQHKEAVPPTPRIDSAVVSSLSKKSSIFSPKSLLFSNVNSNPSKSSSQESAGVTMAKTRRRLRLSSESKSESRVSALCMKQLNQNAPSTSISDSSLNPSERPRRRARFNAVSPKENSILNNDLPF